MGKGSWRYWQTTQSRSTTKMKRETKPMTSKAMRRQVKLRQTRFQIQHGTRE
jgi:hypothetical protein